jgi:hypothetical protein
MKILFVVTSSKTHDHSGSFTIDRVDLTRRLDVINTWGEDVIEYGHDIIFFEGGSEVEYYNDDTKTLHLTESDIYESTGTISLLFNKVQSAFKWILKNKDFDIVYNCDDDVYVNLHQFLKLDLSYDFMSHGAYGGGGFIMSRRVMELIADYKNEQFQNCDVAMYNVVMNNYSSENLKINNSNFSSSPFYVPGELYSTVHYVSGKRAYFIHNIFKYFHENGYTNRKIILGGYLDSQKKNPIVSYESTVVRKTSRWYDFTVDKNNWEYHGSYIRSNLSFNNLKNYWPYSKKSTKYFVINFKNILSDYLKTEHFDLNLNYLIEKCKESLIDDRNLFLMSDGNEEIKGWVIDNDIKERYKLNFELLDNCNFYRRI